MLKVAFTLMLAPVWIIPPTSDAARQLAANSPPSTNTPGKAQADNQQPRADQQDLLRAVFIQTMDAEFRKRDANNDGQISRVELEQFERNQAMAIAQSLNRSLFQRLDVDGSGTLSPGEFAALDENPIVPDIGPQMTKFDANRDQSISLIEFRTVNVASFDRLDADKDGIVTEAERREAQNRVPTGR